MVSIKNRNTKNNKVSRTNVKLEECLIKKEKRDIILFSFRYITKQNNYNFNKFLNSRNKGKDFEILNDIYKKINDMCITGWNGLRSLNKAQGGKEKIDYSQISFNAHDPNRELELSGDSKILIYRFGGNKYRLLCYKSKRCHSALHVIGFDFNYNAYKH